MLTVIFVLSIVLQLYFRVSLFLEKTYKTNNSFSESCIGSVNYLIMFSLFLLVCIIPIDACMNQKEN